MHTELQFEYYYRMEGHFAVGGIDTDFHRNLPNVQERYVNPETGLPEIPLPNVEQVLTVIGTTLLSSASIAAIIKAWLDNHRTKIIISCSNGDRKVEFEGPNLEKSIEAIKEMIDVMASEEKAIQFRIRAIRIGPEQ